MPNLSFTAVILTFATIIGSGTVFFHFVEGWSWVDAYFFTVITLSTVGYGSLVPATVLGKIATTIYIILGIGVFAVAIQHFGHMAVRRREIHTEWLMARLGRHEEPTEPLAANEDDKPQGDNSDTQ